MKRSGFTMVELIFVIVIIGVLAALAIPKFAGVKDNAKATTELAAMSSMDGAIVGAVEFRLQDYDDRKVNWHDKVINTPKNTAYETINTDGDVLKLLMKKGDKFKIIGYSEVNTNDTNATNDILLITGEASNPTNGISEPSDGDILGKPDKNDFWVFNPNNFDVNVTAASGQHEAYTIVEAESIELVDVNATIGTITITSTENGVNTDGVTDVNY